MNTIKTITITLSTQPQNPHTDYYSTTHYPTLFKSHNTQFTYTINNTNPHNHTTTYTLSSSLQNITNILSHISNGDQTLIDFYLTFL